MKHIWTRDRANAPDCAGISRRDCLKVGALGALGLALPEFLRMEAASAAATGKPTKDMNCILMFMNGGPTHMDTWDLKPEAPSEYRGEFKPIKTNVPGIEISEHLPHMAKQADKYAIIRGFTSPEGSHARACHYMLTGYRILPVLEYPAYGSVVLKERGFRNALPPYVAIPNTLRNGGPGYLGASVQPFSVGNPKGGKFNVRDLNSPVDDERSKLRAEMLAKANRRFGKNDPDKTLAPVDRFYEKAFDLVNSADAKKAFDLTQESAKLREEYGSGYGQSCLLARRLVESGTRFVTISKGGWDTHSNNFKSLRERLLPDLDRGFAALLRDLKDRGLLENTLVLWMGEFGRTPKVNKKAGRDHWPRGQSVVFAGAVKGGQIVGKTDDKGQRPVERPVAPADMATTIYEILGIDHRKTYQTSTGRPIRIMEGGSVIDELI